MTEATPAREALSPSSQINLRIEAVLVAISESVKPIGIRAIARRCGLAPSTTHRILLRLEEIGFVKRASRSGWLLAEKLLLLGAVARRQNQLPTLTSPEILTLKKETRGKTLLGLRLQDAVLLCEETAEKTLPLHDSLIGKVFLATFTAEDLSLYLTRNGIKGAQREAIFLDREKLKKNGWLQSDAEDFTQSIVAAPIRQDPTEPARAVLALSFEAGSAIEPATVRALLHAAKQIAA